MGSKLNIPSMKNFVLFGGCCKACSEIHGNGCSECSSITSCSVCVDEFFLNSGVCEKCSEFNANCAECSSIDACTSCDGDLHPNSDGFCVDCQTLYGEGCSECNNTVCKSCEADSCCGSGKKVIVDNNNELTCSTCLNEFGEGCCCCGNCG